MTNTASKLLRALCSMVVMLALVAGITAVPTLAASNGIYTATATPHYRHPDTGVIEDSGGDASEVLGQSMTDSATDTSALVEVDANGNTYITLRLKLSQYTQDHQFWVDANRNGSYTPVSATVMQEDYNADTADYRMQVPSENVVIRSSMYVIPMGREVVWYITVGSLQSGSGDFITSITVQDPEPNVPAQTTPVSSEASSQAESSSSASESPASEASSQLESASLAESSLPSSVSASSVAGLQEFDVSGGLVSEPVSESSASGDNTVVWWIVGGVVVVAIAAGCIWYFCFFKKKK